jgi:hypothetical protein
MNESRGTIVVERSDAVVRVSNDVASIPNRKGSTYSISPSTCSPRDVKMKMWTSSQNSSTSFLTRTAASLLSTTIVPLHSFMPYSQRTSMKLRLLRVSYEPYLIDVETLHREADVFLLHRHLKPSFRDAPGHLATTHTTHHT